MKTPSLKLIALSIGVAFSLGAAAESMSKDDYKAACGAKADAKAQLDEAAGCRARNWLNDTAGLLPPASAMPHPAGRSGG